MNDESTLTRPVGALVHALRILRHLAAQGTAEGVTAIARATDVNGSTCYNILRTLVAEGLVIFDPADKSYRLGLGLVELAVGVLGANPGDLIRPELERLALSHGALMCLWHITDSDRIVLIERAFDPDATRVDLPLGKRLPALIGAVGRMIASHRGLPEAELRRRFDSFHWQRPPRFEAYRDSIAPARARGYAIDQGELYIGVDVVGAIITDAQGTPRYGVSSVTLAGQTDDATRHKIGADLAETCQRIGRSLFSVPHGRDHTPDQDLKILP
ncbi:MAG: IclR family transcriptional regulator [Rhodobacteraceae bacterium]|nr:IclR family transcriptional regulator [Paracoccaceae bacterium]